MKNIFKELVSLIYLNKNNISLCNQHILKKNHYMSIKICYFNIYHNSIINLQLNIIHFIKKEKH